MCLIIKKPAGRRICNAFLTNAWQHNCDGWGSFFLEAGQPVWAKGMRLVDLLRHNDALPESGEVFLHLRKATYGHVTQDMAHPYLVNDWGDGRRMLLMHNGSIDHLAPEDPSLSDTAMLARLLRDMLSGLSADQAAALVRSEGFARLTAPLLQGSMVVLFDHRGARRLGREWLEVQNDQWHAGMAGIEVSNTRTWLRDATQAA
jgi:hypothetical protein